MHLKANREGTVSDIERVHTFFAKIENAEVHVVGYYPGVVPMLSLQVSKKFFYQKFSTSLSIY